MITNIFFIFIGISLITLIIIFLLYRYRNYFNQFKLRKKKKDKEKSLDRALKKYITDSKKDGMKQKLGVISEIITQTESHIDQTVKKKIKLAKSQLKTKEVEFEKGNGAKLGYDSFFSEFKSALPRTEEERKQDMKELMSAISMLESFDDSIYESQSTVFDAGVGIFYDNMSRKFLSFITENKLNKYDFIPIDQIKYYAFNNIKHIRDKDILPILNVMKDTSLLNDIIEINPTFYIIVFEDGEKLDFSLPEKVLLTFAFEQEYLSVQKLMELTDWKEEYANRIMENLIEKSIIKVQNNNIIVEHFGSVEDRRAWKSVIQKKIQEEKIKEQEKRKQQFERANRLRKRLAEMQGVEIPSEEDLQVRSGEKLNKIEFKQKPTVKKLEILQSPINRELNKVKLKNEQEIKDKDDLIGAMEALDEFIPPRSVEKLDLDKHLLEEESINVEELIPQKVLSYHENYSLLNGGFTQFEKLKRFISAELGEVPEDLIKAQLEQLKEWKLIQTSYQIGNHEFYEFNELFLTEDEKTFIDFAVGKYPKTKDDFVKGLTWDDERVLTTMKKLQEKNILRIQKNKIIIPGIIQKD